MTAPAGPAPEPGSIAALCAAAGIKKDALALAGGDGNPVAFIAALVGADRFAEAIQFVAHALPRREAVWWAWYCARQSAGDAPEPPVRATLEATERWIAQPTDEHRRAVIPIAEAAGYDTAAGLAALGAFLSGGSLGPPTAPPVPPGEFQTAKAVSGAVTLAAVADDPSTAFDRFRLFIDQGVKVATRIGLWR